MEWKMYYSNHQREVHSFHKTEHEALALACVRLQDGYSVRIEGPNGVILDEAQINKWRQQRNAR